MGSLDIKSDQAPTVLEPEHEVLSNGNESTVDSPTTSDKNDLLDSKSEPASASDANELIVLSPTALGEQKRKINSLSSCSSSISSTDSMLEDPFQDANDEDGEKVNGKESDSKVPISTSGSTGTDYTSETPPIQVMERPTTQKYRIPSSAFAREKSTGGDWGMASNESLFSIQIGGRSFCYQDSLYWKSGELDLDFTAEPSTSGQLINFPHENQFQDGKPTELGTISELDETGKSHDLDVADKNHKLSDADENQEHTSHLQGNREDQGSKSVVEERTSRFSAESDGSTKSFAFPVLTAETDKGYSATMTGSLKAISETSKSEPQLETDPEPESQPQPSGPKADTPAAAPATTWTKCFPCVGCCAFSS